MPKEKIGGIDCPDIDLVVEVGWQAYPAGTVQVGAVQLSNTPADEYRMKIDGKPVNGWYVSLDRNGLNRMIRTLRKARDQAYGRDE